MYEAAEHQLALVSRKTCRLGEVLRQQIDALKELRSLRRAVFAERDELRRRLQLVEEKANVADRQHSEAELCLQHTAEEFAVTQLLQKRYANTLAELKGGQRVVVQVAAPAARDSGPAWEEAARDSHLQQQEPQREKEKTRHGANIAVTDKCTVVDLDRRRTFVVDAAYTVTSLRRRMQSEAALAGAAGTASNTDDMIPRTFMPDEEFAAAIRVEHAVADALSGANLVFLSFGPAGGGKTETLFGTRAAIFQNGMLQQQRQQRSFTRRLRRSASNERAPSADMSFKSLRGCEKTAGLLSLFVCGLFNGLVEHAVTHFSISCSFLELAMNQTVDLLLRKPGRPMSGGGANNTTLVKLTSATAGDSFAAPLSCSSGTGEEVTAVRAETAEDVIRVFFEGLERFGRWRRSFSSWLPAGGGRGSNNNPGGQCREDDAAFVAHCGGVSHAIFSLRVESFNEKGHYRRSLVSFVDLCGPPPEGARPAMQPMQPETQWVEESLQAVCDAIAATSSVTPAAGQKAAARAEAAFDQLPSSHTNCLVRFLRPIFGGNAKATLVCCVDVELHSKEEVLNAISYAYFFKRITHQAIPYDIPPELQRLNLQMSTFLSGDGDECDDDNDIVTSGNVGNGTMRSSLAPIDASVSGEGFSCT
ncbi:hypothetical protein TraAM80_02796 [Trypanosoma rangeli]|uniref:Kinesin motor domain-containing protein n=1 Tax=Trypanosoma rangeli TaxID=5698 RepID=A0A3R7NVB6_TRYRA|nr:uncharacterized protein TraAM80_02796 [Trypanosoma rangeli]RNF08290.1 hypothetical protein TraAM80_02796 [Trypanosoma rangeli]|eukprot:RNF08290.1 hypothetical protein TraAM80_02796 [Trypanosoma rangeli]